jgi:uncharacterized protein (DUF305 family)
VVSTAYTLDKDRIDDGRPTTTHSQGADDKLSVLKGDDFDKAFLKEMIDHHQGAIDMAMLAEANAKHGEIKKLSQDILSAQSSEIDMMQTWQTDWGYKIVPRSHDSQ